MKLYSKIILSAILAATSLSAYAGDYCFSPGRSCNVSSGSGGGGNGACCNNSGYLFGYGGFSFGTDFTANIQNLLDVQNALGDFTIPPTEEFSLDSGFIIGGGAGVRSCFLGGSRFEIEGLFIENDLEGIQNINGPVNGAEGEFSTSALMANFLKEIPLGCITGYVGAGIGVAMTEADVTFAGELVSDQDFAIAHQFIVGADIPVADCLSLFLQYKLFNRGDVILNCPTGVRGVTKAAEFEGSYQSNLVFGARFFY